MSAVLESQAVESTETFERVPVGAPEYNRIVEFLYDEAALLDQIRLTEWAATLATDLVYNAPLRETRGSAHQAATYVRSVQHYHDDYRSVMGRIMRLTGKSAWAEDPPSWAITMRRRKAPMEISLRHSGLKVYDGAKCVHI